MGPFDPKILIDKITALPVELMAEVEQFVDQVREREQDRALAHAATSASAPAFAAVWNNPEDDAFDAL
jgi:hypothetical protein